MMDVAIFSTDVSVMCMVCVLVVVVVCMTCVVGLLWVVLWVPTKVVRGRCVDVQLFARCMFRPTDGAGVCVPKQVRV